MPSTQDTREEAPAGQREIATLACVVDDYIERFGMKKAQELAYYANQASLADVVAVAARFQAPNGRCQPRQSRIPRASKDGVQAALDAEALGSPTSFAELERTLSERIGKIRGVGELTVYDTALRIGAFLGLLPQEIYLHGSTREGAEALGLDVSGRTAPVAALPREFSVLEPWELEDCLGTYKDDLARITRSPRAA